MDLRRTMTIGACLLLVVTVPAVVEAGHNFIDVPDTHTFHSDIEWLSDADVTKGCNPPANDMFCPGDNVTRGQMAAFMHRLGTNPWVRVANVPAQAFQPFDETDPFTLGDFRGATGSSGTGTLWAPVSLPHGAVVTKVECVFYDGTATADVGCRVRRGPLAEESVFSVSGFLVSSGSAGFERIVDSSPDETPIDNLNNIYYVQVAPSSGSWEGLDTTIKAVVITYEAPLTP